MLQIENYKPATQSELATIYNLLYRDFCITNSAKDEKILGRRKLPNQLVTSLTPSFDTFAGRLKDGLCFIDFDTKQDQDLFLEKVLPLFNIKPLVLETEHGIHVYFRIPKLEKPLKEETKFTNFVGLNYDQKASYGDKICCDVLKAFVDRSRAFYIPNGFNNIISELPFFMLSYIKGKEQNKPTWCGLGADSKRNDTIFNELKQAVKAQCSYYGVPKNDWYNTYRNTACTVNECCFLAPLSDDELATSTRQEAFGVLTASKNTSGEPVRSQIAKICDELQALGSYKYDSFTNQTFYNDKQVNDLVVTKIRHDMTMTASADNVIASINYLADQNKFDSMNELLDKLPAWDNVKRCEEFFIRYCGADDTRYSRLCGLYFWTSLYNRAYGATPFKADTSIVLKGKQGIYKSTLLDVLSFGYCGAVDFKKKYDDNVRAMQAKVICEVAELKGMSNADVNDLKDFLSKTVDRYTPKFANYEREFVRRCVFVMTTNEANFLRDVTGNRRYAVIECTKEIELEQVKADLKQLWAEAKTLKFDLELVKELEKEIVKVQQNYIELPLYHEQIVKLLEERQTSTNTAFTSKPLTTQTICDYLHVTVLNKNIKNEISKSMKLLGYDLKLQRLKGKIEGGDNRFYLWVKS